MHKVKIEIGGDNTGRTPVNSRHTLEDDFSRVPKPQSPVPQHKLDGRPAQDNQERAIVSSRRGRLPRSSEPGPGTCGPGSQVAAFCDESLAFLHRRGLRPANCPPRLASRGWAAVGEVQGPERCGYHSAKCEVRLRTRFFRMLSRCC